MKRRQRLIGFTALLLLLVTAKLGQQVYRWYAYQEERAEIGRLELDLEDAALGVVRTQMRADALRREIDEGDEELAAGRVDLDRLEREILPGTATAAIEARYRRDLRSYNERVAARNQLFREWLETVSRNHRHVERYNELVDSIRTVAERMGEPYYPIRSPAEIANAKGVLEGG